MIVLPDSNRDRTINLSERIRKTIENHLGPLARVPDDRVITVSLGASVGRPDDDTPEEIIKRADQALYQAKQAGRNRVEFI